jgi:hypothetical protein
MHLVTLLWLSRGILTLLSWRTAKLNFRVLMHHHFVYWNKKSWKWKAWPTVGMVI